MSREVPDRAALDERSEGALGIKVRDSNGDLKEDVIYTRVVGDGAVEARRKGSAPNLAQNNFIVKRRDLL